ncbi:MAG: hypothetical protein IPO46_11305 [Chitinophagaceae bacterium]|jgi:hypothetical protein|nr:hypothetical protein [Chitinophagaceae bacterium]MBP6046204.1 hypothetical protein [Ferruginibacter sp.]MBK7087367.1 hypothetical protein [Chitinophagaceae bacterium]MBK7345417.1 hypothetical protein [Chitinophagaceae bacterium]MBK7735675.1 hypothetical protein [Chitinophagaceae bacterium]
MKQFFLLSSAVCIAFAANAKIWRVNNNAGVTADFTDMPACIASSSVVNDDSIYVESSVTMYTNFTLNKRLVIIGTGYFLSGVNSNPGLQANTNPATLNYCYIDTLASGSQFIGINFSDGIYTVNGQGADNISFTRCSLNQMNIGYGGPLAGADYTGWIINKCYITSITSSNRPVKNATITNNIFIGAFDTGNSGNLNNLLRNNVFRNVISANNTYFANNIITNITFSATNSTVKNNTCIGAAPAGFAPFVGLNGNVAGELDANIFQGLTGNSTDGQWRLKAGSQAIATGETVSSITPDRGAFGTADPYVLSGIAAIPTIYSLTVPASVASNATTMPITISTKSNN